MEEVTVHIPLAADLRGRVFVATGVAAPTEWVVAVDPRGLERAEREHLLRMADSNGICALWRRPSGGPPREAWVGTYVPNPASASVRRDQFRLSLDACSDDDRVVVAAALAALGAADGESAADAAAVAAAAIRADRLRWEAARDAALAALHDAVAAWLVQAEERAADLRTRGGSALTPREIEDGMAPRKPSWFDAVIAADADACGARLAAAWDALSAAWTAAYAEACAERDARRRAEKEAEEAAEVRRQAEIRAWIAAHGSDRLRRLLDAGYPIWQEYVRERVAREFPGFTPDLNREARWRDLKETDPAPTDEQIALAQRFGGRAVLLTCDTRDYRRSAVAVVIADAFHGMTLVETAVDAREDDEA
jgi:hypothetical protein